MATTSSCHLRPKEAKLDDIEELEWAARQYEIATEYLMGVLAKHEDVSARLGYAIVALCDAIEAEWADE